MKRVMILLCSLYLLFITDSVVEAKVICNVGSTNGVLYSNDWQFYIEKTNDDLFNWKFQNTVYEFCSSASTCKHLNIKQEDTNQKSLDSLFNNKYYENIYSDKSENGAYTNEELKELLQNGTCPEYIYIGDSKKKQKIAFIFSSSPINNAADIFKDHDYFVAFSQDGGSNLLEEYIEAYNNSIETMKKNLQMFKDEGWDQVYSTRCVSPGLFGGFDTNENAIINNYDKYRNLIAELNSNYDFSAGDELRKEYINTKCGGNKDNQDNDKPIEDVCEVLPESIKNYIMDALNLIRWVSLALMIVLGTLDFVKAAASDDQDALKKAWQNFIKRLIAVIILFLLPILVEFILYIAGLAGFGECYPITDF